jgi:hypothetical protein
MFNFGTPYIEPVKDFGWKQTITESRRNYIKTNNYRVCVDYIEWVEARVRVTLNLVSKSVALVYLEGRKEPFRMDGVDADQFILAWDSWDGKPC